MVACRLLAPLFLPLLLLLLSSFPIFASASPLEENAFRALLRQKTEEDVARINKLQTKWTAKVHPRFAAMTDEELRGMLGLLETAEEQQNIGGSSGFMGLKEWRESRANGRAADGNSTTISPSTSTTSPGPSPTTSNSTSPSPTTPSSPSSSSASPVSEDRFDAREEWPECAELMDKIQDQSLCGSCWAVSAATVMQDRICIGSRGKVQVDISAEDVLSCTSPFFGCNGGIVSEAFQSWQYRGFCTGAGSDPMNNEGCKPYPFPLYKTPECTEECKNPNYTVPFGEDKYYGQKPVYFNSGDQEDIKDALREGGPVVASFTVYSDFFSYYSGVYEHTPGAKVRGGHAVRIIGWGEENGTPYWLVANSWNKSWGERGWFKIVRGQNECAIERKGINFAYAKIDEEN